MYASEILRPLQEQVYSLKLIGLQSDTSMNDLLSNSTTVRLRMLANVCLYLRYSALSILHSLRDLIQISCLLYNIQNCMIYQNIYILFPKEGQSSIILEVIYCFDIYCTCFSSCSTIFLLSVLVQFMYHCAKSKCTLVKGMQILTVEWELYLHMESKHGCQQTVILTQVYLSLGYANSSCAQVIQTLEAMHRVVCLYMTFHSQGYMKSN